VTPFGPLVTLHRRVQTGVDRYNGPTYTTTDVVVKSIAFDHGGSVELADGLLSTVSRPTAFLTPDTVVSHLDGITANGVRYEVDGTPTPGNVNPWTGWQPGIEVRLRLPTG
jgi:hypothetical protein